jgi:hypothetical protein
MSPKITDSESKKKRLAEIDEFVRVYGRGDIGLSEDQKKARMQKFISSPVEVEKVLGLGKDPLAGVKLDVRAGISRKYSENFEGPNDPLVEVLKDIQRYPVDLRGGDGTDHRIIFLKVFGDGRIEVEHLIIDGRESDSRIRSLSGVMVMNDKMSAESEYRLFKAGKLKEVSDRTMIIHKDKNRLDELFNDPNVDTDADKALQI